MSKNIDILEDDQGLSIQVKWFSPKAYFLLFFTLFWNGIIYFLVNQIWLAGAPLIALLAPVFHIGIGVFLVYYVSALFLNKSYLEIDDEALKVHHDPLPWFKGKKNIPLEELEQLYVKQVAKKSKSGTGYSYSLRAKLIDGMDEKIFKLEHLESQDLFTLEEKLENYLGIKDKYVKGEFGSKSRTEDLNLDENPILEKEKSILKAQSKK